jgi:hypothetical protein
MRKLIYVCLVLFVTSCAVTNVNETKRHRPLVVESIRYNNAYRGKYNQGKYIVVAFREGDYKKFVIKTNELICPNDTFFLWNKTIYRY